MHLSAPRIVTKNVPTTAQSGPVRFAFDLQDDQEIASVITYVGGEKFSYSEGGQPNLSVALDVILDEGPNSIGVRVVDNQGLERVQSWVIQGLPARSTTDVDEAP